jgi:hypothetical protein
MPRSTLRAIGGALMLFWLVSLLVGILMLIRQPQQLGIPEAYIYWRIVGEGPAWAFFVAIGLLHLAANPGPSWKVAYHSQTAAYPQGEHDDLVDSSWVHRAGTFEGQIRSAGRFVLLNWIVLVGVGLALGWFLRGDPYNAAYDVVFKAVCEPPAWIVAAALIAALWKSR